jgi:hypothetical protein
MSKRNARLASLQARLTLLRTAPAALDLEVRRLEKEALVRLKDLRGLLGRSPEEARRVLETLITGPMTFTPVETADGRRYQVDAELSIGAVLSARPVGDAPQCLRPQGESKGP